MIIISSIKGQIQACLENTRQVTVRTKNGRNEEDEYVLA